MAFHHHYKYIKKIKLIAKHTKKSVSVTQLIVRGTYHSKQHNKLDMKQLYLGFRLWLQ